MRVIVACFIFFLSVSVSSFQLEGRYKLLEKASDWKPNGNDLLMLRVNIGAGVDNKTLTPMLGSNKLEVYIYLDNVSQTRNLGVRYQYNGHIINYPILDQMFGDDGGKYTLKIYFTPNFIWMESSRYLATYTKVYNTPIFFGVGNSGMEDIVNEAIYFGDVYQYTPPTPIATYIDTHYSQVTDEDDPLIENTAVAVGVLSSIFIETN